jgi:hypothetical protein
MKTIISALSIAMLSGCSSDIQQAQKQTFSHWLQVQSLPCTVHYYNASYGETGGRESVVCDDGRVFVR